MNHTIQLIFLIFIAFRPPVEFQHKSPFRGTQSSSIGIFVVEAVARIDRLNSDISL